jgi:hypothetical protein
MNDHDMKTKLGVLHETIDKLVRPSGTSLRDYSSIQSPRPSGRWTKSVIAEAEKSVAQAPPVIPSGPWSSGYAPELIEPPFPVDINFVPPVDPPSVALAFPATVEAGEPNPPAPGHGFPSEVEAVPHKPKGIRRL